MESEKKRHIEFLKHTENQTGQRLILKNVVRRVTIEGEHTYLMIMREDKEMGKKQVIELQPMINAPHQLSALCIPTELIKFALPYRYLFEYKAIRIVTHNSNEEFILVFGQVNT